MLTKDELDALKLSIDPISLLLHLGFDIKKETHKELRGPCIIHGGDNASAFRFNKNTNTWVCFTNKCNETAGNDVIGLIMAAKRLTFQEALLFLSDFVGDSKITAVDVLAYKHRKDKQAFIRNTGIIHKPDIVNEDFLESCKKFRSDLFVKDGFAKPTLDHFEIAGGYTDKIGHIRDIIPIRSDTGELVAFSFRDTEDNCNDDYKYIATDDFDKDRVLYNIYGSKAYAQTLPLRVVEGFKSVWRLHEFGIYNCVAIMGSNMTVGQVNLLLAYAINGVVLMLDNDKAGKDGTALALKAFGNKTKVTPIYIKEKSSKGKGLDPSDLTSTQLMSYIEAI